MDDHTARNSPESIDSLSSPSDQRVTFVELFFDLVFVFCVTQIVSLLHDGVTWKSIGEAILVFWMVWWGWTQFTWALNAADTTNPRIEVATLVATGVTFFLAVGIPSAFHGRPLWFAGTYVTVRVLGLLVYDLVTSSNPAQRAAVRHFSTVSLGGLAAVLIGGFTGGTAQYIWWAVAIGLDLIAAALSARIGSWNLHAEHFSERHGLFVIIALGESLIVAALGLTDGEWPADQLITAMLAVAIAGTMWWSYFVRNKIELDDALKSVDGRERSMLARDAYSIIHFPMVLGIIAFAAAIEHALGHPSDPLGMAYRSMLAVSILLFAGGTGLALWRAGKPVGPARRILPIVTAGVILALGDVPALISLALMLVGWIILALVEPVRMRHSIGAREASARV